MVDLLAPRPDAVDERVCSAKGCREDAAWGLLWNNPRLHTPERRKVWLACDAHREHLEQFLGARSFLQATVPVDRLDGPDGPGDAGAAGDGDGAEGDGGADGRPREAGPPA